jgi:hypothetical protein
MNYSQAVQRLLDKPFFSYMAITLLQLKVVWRIWDYKDLTSGDTSAYFLDAYTWFDSQAINIIWSPLYTTFYGSLLHITPDIYTVTILHRLIIIFASSLLVLAVMRKLLPEGIALLISAWWVILPINFNTLYEVHLFSIIPVLTACLLLLSKQTIWTRGGAIAILAGASVLVRNELSVVTLFLLSSCTLWEIWQYKTQKPSVRQYLLGYGIPLVLAGLTVLFFYSRSYLHFSDPALAASAEAKHTLNICQVYAFGYQQRHPEWNLSPWTECHGLMEQTFGQSLPSLVEALGANPIAILEHFRWNTSLALNGIQVSLFNATSGAVNPDYAPVHLNSNWVIIPTIAVGLILMIGLIQLYRNRHFWWESWLKQRIWGWLILIAVAAVTVFLVIPTQRPRPSYMFVLAILLMAATGMSLVVITLRWSAALKRFNLLIPTIAVMLLIAVPNYYTNSERRLLDLYNRFQPFQNLIAEDKTVFLTREFSNELCSYLRKAEMCKPLSYASNDFFAEVPETRSLKGLLNQQKVNLFYVDANLLQKLESNPRTQKFLTEPGSMGWKLIAMEDSGDRWMLFQRLRRRSVQQNDA